MRSLKKLLAVVVAICVLATFTLPAFAADAATLSADAQTCANIGVLVGQGSDGVTAAYAATIPTRAQAAVMVLRLTGNLAAAQAYTGTENFADANTVSWAAPLMGYLKTHPELGFVGDGTNFNPKGNITAQEYYKVLLTALGYAIPADYAYANTLTFAKDTVKLAMAGNVASFTIDSLATATVEGLNGAVKGGTKTLAATLVDAGKLDKAAAITAGLYSDVVTATAAATGAKKLTVTFNQAIDTTKATFVAKRGPTTLSIGSITFSDDKKQATINTAAKLIAGDYTITVSGLTTDPIALTIVGIKDETETKFEITSDTAASTKSSTGVITGGRIGYKIYNQYNEDITKDAATEDIRWTFSLGTATDDNDGVVDLSIPNTITVGQTAVLTGVMTSAGIVATKTITVGAESAVDSITFDKIYNEDEKTLDTGSDFSAFALVISSAKDQYGNDMTADDLNNNLVVTSSNTSVVALASCGTNANGLIYVDDSFGPESDKLGIGFVDPTNPTDGTSTIRLISRTTGKIFTFDVVAAKKSTIESIQLQYPDNVVAAGDDAVTIPFTALDQSGNAVTSFDTLTADVTLSTTDLYFEKDYVKGVAVLKYIVPSGVGAPGNYTVMAMSKSTGKSSQLTINVKDPAVPSVITGVTSDVTTNIAKNATTSIRYGFINVHDQYDRSYDLTDDFMLTAGGTTADKYRIVVKKDSASNDKVSLSAGTVEVALVTPLTPADGIAIYKKDDNSKVIITGDNKGSSTIDLILEQYVENETTHAYSWVAVPASQYNLSMSVVEKSSIASYVVDDIGTIYDTASMAAKLSVTSATAINVSDHQPEIKVSGVKADGSKVAIATADYSVVTDNGNVIWNRTTNKLEIASRVTDADNSTVDVTVIVNVEADGNAQTIVKNIKISDAIPKAASIALDSGYDKASDAAQGAKYVSAGLISIKKYIDETSPTTMAATILDATRLNTAVRDASIVKDQYGQEISTGYYGNGTIFTSNMVMDNGDPATISTIDKGGSFNVTIVVNGQSLVFKVKIV